MSYARASRKQAIDARRVGILRAHREGRDIDDIAERFGMTTGNVRRIINYWRDDADRMGSTMLRDVGQKDRAS